MVRPIVRGKREGVGSGAVGVGMERDGTGIMGKIRCIKPATQLVNVTGYRTLTRQPHATEYYFLNTLPFGQ
jgi:hypothetical protein